MFCFPFSASAWHDSGNYDKTFGTGGATGSIRFSKELAHGGNAGLTNALRLLEPIKEKFPDVGYADLFQMASAAAIKASGGPDIPMRYGRVDATSEDQVPREGRLPDGAAPFGQSDGENPGEKSKDPSPSAHLRRVVSEQCNTNRNFDRTEPYLTYLSIYLSMQAIGPSSFADPKR